MFRISSFGVGVGLSLAVCCGAAAQSTITGRLQQKRGDVVSPLRACTVFAASSEKGPLVGEYPDDEGRFHLDFPPDDRITVGTVCPGFRLASVQGQTIEVDEPALPTHDCSSPGVCAELELLAEPLAVIEGEVVDDNGLPLEGVRLGLAREVGVPESLAYQAVSDDRGYFRFFHLPPGVYELLRIDGSSALSPTQGDPIRLTAGAGDIVSTGQVRMPSRRSALMVSGAWRLPSDDTAQPDAASDGLLTVKVTDSFGAPVVGAQVAVQGGPRGARPVLRHLTTDAAGEALFRDLPNGAFWMEAQLAGYSLPHRGRQIELGGAEARVAVEIQLARRPVLSGRVVDEQGTPMPDTRIQLFELLTGDGVPMISPSWSTVTDDRGSYRLSVPEPGRYWVMATHMEATFPLGSAPQPTGSVFYPNSPDLLSSLPAELLFDQGETTFDFTLPPAPRTELAAGLLSGHDGSPCAQCAYSLRRVEGPYDYELIGDTISGRLPGFEYRGIPPGQYRIFVEDQADGALGWWAIEDVSLVEDRLVAVTVETQSPVDLAGRVTLEDPPPGWIAEHLERADAVQIQLTQIGNPFFAVHRSSATVTQSSPEQPRFRLGPLPPGKFRVEVWAQGTDAYLAGVSRQGRPLSAPLFDLSQPGGWSNLELRVRFDMARPAIRIPAETTRGESWSMHRLVLAPDVDQNPFGFHLGYYQEGYCGPDGGCEISPVPPGRYLAFAFRQLPGGVNLELLKKLAPWGRAVDLTAGENASIEMKPVPQKVIEGI